MSFLSIFRLSVLQTCLGPPFLGRVSYLAHYDHYVDKQWLRQVENYILPYQYHLNTPKHPWQNVVFLHFSNPKSRGLKILDFLSFNYGDICKNYAREGGDNS